MHRAQASNEHGFALIEAIVSAAVLALVAIAILAGIDGATSSAGREKGRAIAASLAEEDQERMRSMSVDTLAGLTESRTESIDGTTYRIDSESRWVRDDTGGTPSCINNEEESDYLRITTVVRTDGGTRSFQPVEITSLVAPSVAYSTTRGSLAVKVTDHDGQPVQGLAVTISGGSSDAKQTNEDGCALFEYIPTGNYVAQLNTPGWVDHWGNQVAQGNIVVSSGNLNVLAMTYDRKADVAVGFTTTKPGTSEAISSAGRSVSATNGEKPGLRRVFTSTLPAADNLFPFNTPYAFYAGRCRASDPTVAYNANYFQVQPGLAASVALEPGGAGTAWVRQPPLSIRVRDRGGAYINGATVYAKLRTPTEPDGSRCDEPVFELTTRDNPYRPTAERTGWASKPGSAFDSGVPFGVYDVCAEYYDSGRRRYYHDTDTYSNITPNGLANVAGNGNAGMRIDAGDSGGCPSW